MTSGEHSPGLPSCLLLWRQTLGLMHLFFPLRWYQNFPQCSLGRSPFLKFRAHNLTSILYSCIPYIMSCFSLFRIVGDWVNYIRIFSQTMAMKIYSNSVLLSCPSSYFLTSIFSQLQSLLCHCLPILCFRATWFLWFPPQLFNDNIYWESFPRRLYTCCISCSSVDQRKAI